jgi:hypothetical protein
MFRFFIPVIVVLVLSACAASKKAGQVPASPVTPVVGPDSTNGFSKEDAFFVSLFRQYPDLFNEILKNRKPWNVQVIYTEINRKKNGRIKLKHHYFNRTNATYFYPASTVKFPIVLLALQKLRALKGQGIGRETAMITETAYSGQSTVFNDANSYNGSPAIGQYIKKILLVSDNDAFNRLYEFLGQEYINSELHKKGFTDVQVLHRLNIFLSEEENRHTNPVAFFDTSKGFLYRQPMLYNPMVFDKRPAVIGKGYYSNGVLVNRPMDFSAKNRLPLQDLHDMLQGLVFPASVPPSKGFDITDDDRLFVLKAMSQFPRESVYPYYDSSCFDAYAKFLLYGGDTAKQTGNIRVFNKSGNAYGQLTDAAYIVDHEKKIEFFVSAAIYCNTDEILNDDKYDYTSIGLPFMKNLGRVLYEYEVKRKRKHRPDLSRVAFTYDK